jgi:hypothetical protein
VGRSRNHLICRMQGLDNSYSYTEDFVYIGQLPIWAVKNQAIQGHTVDYDWIRLRLGGQGPEQSIRTTEWIDLWTTRFSGRFMDISWILRIRLSLQVVFGRCLCFAYCLCLYAGLTYSIVLTIVHFDGTSILSLYNTLLIHSIFYLITSSSFSIIHSSVLYNPLF